MKTLKKQPRKQLEKFSTIFTQLGLVLVLFIVYVVLEHETIQKEIVILTNEHEETDYFDPSTERPFQREVKPEKTIETPKTNAFILDEPVKTTKSDNDETTIIIKNEEPKKVDIHTIVIKKEDVGTDDEDLKIPFITIENAPVFKGCEGLSKAENKKCFEEKLQQFVMRNFDPSIAEDLGLKTGIHRIYSQFVIDKTGKVVDIQIKAPHQKLKSETQEILEKLPQFTPGKQRNKPVKVGFSFPITFKVE